MNLNKQAMSKQTILAFSQQYTRKGSLKIDDFCNEKAANNKVIENSIRNISLSQQVTNQSKPKDIYNYELEVAYDNNLSKIETHIFVNYIFFRISNILIDKNHI